MAIETTVTPIADLEELFGLEVQCEVWILGQDDQYGPCTNAAEYQVVQGCCGTESLMCIQCFREMLSPGIVCEPCDFMSWPKMTRGI